MAESRQLPPDLEGPNDPEIRIHATFRMLIPAKKRKEALVILGSMIERIKLEAGCISCRLYQEVKGTRAVMLEEIWASREGLLRHLRSAAFRNILLVVEMASQAPEIRFDRISHSTGIDTIEQARNQVDVESGVSRRQPPP
ncbi:MAG: antibiotic biosynthesis monooxygenase family protein [Desulfobacterales bacterium]